MNGAAWEVYGEPLGSWANSRRSDFTWIAQNRKDKALQSAAISARISPSVPVGSASDCESAWRFLTDRRDAPILAPIETVRSKTFTPSTIKRPPTWSHAMRPLPIRLLGALLLDLLFACQLNAQETSDGSTSTRTFRPVVRGTQYAVSSMKQEATRAAARILESGGNAFDAIVAGQAVLALVNPESNGLGADAVILVYHAGEKQVYSINAEGTAPKLATIDWFNKNNGGKIPNSDGLLSASLPGVIDAWYVLLDRWGTMTFAQVLEQAIDVAENGFPIGDGLARAIAGSKKIQKYPTSRKVYFPNGKAPHPGDIFRNVDSARMLRKLVEAEQAAAGQGRRQGLRRARSLL